MIAASEDKTHKEGYWINELILPGIKPRWKNELNDVEELEALANNMKQVYYQDYKTAYDANNSEIKRRERWIWFCDLGVRHARMHMAEYQK